jgi:hypothetical protein
MVFLTIAMAFLSNGCFLAETVLKDSILFVLTALTSIIGHVHTPIFLAQRAAFLDFRLLGFSKFVGICTLMFAFSSGFFSTFLCNLFLGIGICYYFLDVLKNAQ